MQPIITYIWGVRTQTTGARPRPGQVMTSHINKLLTCRVVEVDWVFPQSSTSFNVYYCVCWRQASYSLRHIAPMTACLPWVSKAVAC